MSQVVEDFILEHYGAKGMKWGVRRAQKKAAQADAKWQKNIYSTKGAVAIHNNVADKMNGGALDKLNNQPKYNKLDAFDKPNHPTTKQYFREYEKLTEKLTREAVTEVHGTSPSGKLVAKLDTSGSDWKVTISPVDLTHAAVAGQLVMELNHDDSGHITSARKIQETIEQSTFVEDFIEHYGAKGMKWGVRKSRSSVSKGKSTSKGKKSSTDYKQTAPLRGKKPHQLTNKQLKAVNERINLERNYSRLNPTKMEIGRSTVKGFIAALGSAASLYGLMNSPAGKAAIESGKKALTSSKAKAGALKIARTGQLTLPGLSP